MQLREVDTNQSLIGLLGKSKLNTPVLALLGLWLCGWELYLFSIDLDYVLLLAGSILNVTC